MSKTNIFFLTIYIIALTLSIIIGDIEIAMLLGGVGIIMLTIIVVGYILEYFNKDKL